MAKPQNPSGDIPLHKSWDSADFALASYQKQLDYKVSQCLELMAPYSPPAPEIFKSPEQGYRQRCEFHVLRENDNIQFAMLKPGTKSRFAVTRFPAASPVIQMAMPILRDILNQMPALNDRLFRVDFLSTLSGDLLITLVYHRPLDEDWQQAAEQVRKSLKCQLIGRSRKQKIALGNDYVTEKLAVNGQIYHYRQMEGGFTQPNALVNHEMLEWAQDAAQHTAKHLQGDLLELYCGNGNFTLPLSRHFGKVLATEVSKTSIAALNWNLEANNIQNIHCARLSAAEAARAMNRERPFKRLQHINLDSFEFDTLFVDPPRAGIDSNTLVFASQFDRIIYISCNPQTLADNLRILSQTHRVDQLACFDQFPFTPHLEVGVRLIRN